MGFLQIQGRNQSYQNQHQNKIFHHFQNQIIFIVQIKNKHSFQINHLHLFSFLLYGVNIMPNVAILTYDFWLSALFILGMPFIAKQSLSELSLIFFFSYAVVYHFIKVGSFIAGVCADFYGRKIVFFFFSLILQVAALLLMVSPWAAYTLAGFAIGPINNLAFVYINENHPEKAQRYIIIVLVGWAAGEISLGIYFYFSSSIEMFKYILIILTTVYIVAVAIVVEETTQYHQYQQRHQISFQAHERQHEQQNICKRLLSVIPKNRKALIGASLVMFSTQLFYYRTQFTLDQFGLSMPINTIVVGFTQIVANVTFFPFLHRVRRRLTLRILLLSLMGFLFCLLQADIIQVQTVIEGLMRLLETASMLLLGVYIPQMFQVEDKSKGTNFVMSFGVIGSALSQTLLANLPFWSLEFFIVMSLLATLLLSETKKQPQNRLNQTNR